MGFRAEELLTALRLRSGQAPGAKKGRKGRKGNRWREAIFMACGDVKARGVTSALLRAGFRLRSAGASLCGAKSEKNS